MKAATVLSEDDRKLEDLLEEDPVLVGHIQQSRDALRANERLKAALKSVESLQKLNAVSERGHTARQRKIDELAEKMEAFGPELQRYLRTFLEALDRAGVNAGPAAAAAEEFTGRGARIIRELDAAHVQAKEIKNLGGPLAQRRQRLVGELFKHAGAGPVPERTGPGADGGVPGGAGGAQANGGRGPPEGAAQQQLEALGDRLSRLLGAVGGGK